MNFDMSIDDNYASFIDSNTGISVLVDSFDNNEFEVRIGTTESSEKVGTIVVSTTEELNQKLGELFKNTVKEVK